MYKLDIIQYIINPQQCISYCFKTIHQPYYYSTTASPPPTLCSVSSQQVVIMAASSMTNDVHNILIDEQYHQNQKSDDETPVNTSPPSTGEASADKGDGEVEDDGAIRDKSHLGTWRFYAILVSLSITGLLTTIEGTIITNALPTITAALGGGNSFLWIANAYFLASVATLPLYAQASNIFGRRWLLLGAVGIFVLGSGLCGGSSSMGMLIASRTVQGLGGGGISLLIETVVQDLVPLRERGKYMAIVLMCSTVGAALGPLLGGLIASDTTWRWVFYINVPVGGGTYTHFAVPLLPRPMLINSQPRSWHSSSSCASTTTMTRPGKSALAVLTLEAMLYLLQL